MCGISGFLDIDSGVDLAVLRRMNDVIRHRGPDDEGYALIGPESLSLYGGPDSTPSLGLPPLDGAETRGFLGLGHRRLSILDLTPGGHQPMGLPERELTVVYNGEIYNYLEVRQELEALGHSFRTDCDTEVLLHAYAQWGEDCLTRFNGMWSFALWDGQSRRLFCARDRLGAKPFHYWHKGNKLLFGSELKQLCQDDSVPRRFDRSYLAATLMYRLTDYNDQTLIQDMHALRPGHKLVAQMGADGALSVAVSAYWELRVEYDASLTAAQWQEQIAAEFARSCRWRLRSDAPLGALLSGGLDSSCMAAELCGQMSDPAALRTFTTSYPGHEDCDEWNFADMVNHHCGCRGQQVIPDPTADIEDRFERIIWHVEGFGGLSLLGPQILLEEIHRQGLKVILNGQCGDETMLGYERYYAFYFAGLLKQGDIAAAQREFRLASQHSRLSAVSLAAMFAYFNFPAVRDGRQLRRAGRYVRRELLEDREQAELHSLLYPKSLAALQKTELTATQLPSIVRYDDRLYMSASIESRIPFMDYRFVELACRIPPEMKIQNGYTKNIMREVFDSRLPKAVTWRTNKMGFGAPVQDWAAAFSPDYLREMMRSAKAAAYFRLDRLEQTLDASPTDPSLFDFLQVEQFARQFGVE